MVWSNGIVLSGVSIYAKGLLVCAKSLRSLSIRGYYHDTDFLTSANSKQLFFWPGAKKKNPPVAAPIMAPTARPGFYPLEPCAIF